jgi:hypothetical protein
VGHPRLSRLSRGLLYKIFQDKDGVRIRNIDSGTMLTLNESCPVWLDKDRSQGYRRDGNELLLSKRSPGSPGSKLLIS